MKLSATLLLISACLLPATLHAQKYARTPGDTLRYRETSKITSSSETPNGPITMVMETGGLVSLAFFTGDTARVWYDSLMTKMDSPMGNIGDEYVQQMLKKPFTLRFLPNGNVELVSAPSIQGPTGSIAMMQNGFHEWFPKLPANLTIGSAWQDTITTGVSPMPGLTANSTSIRGFRVARDSSAFGMRVFVIETTITQEMKSSGEMSGIVVNSTMKGEFSGTILFAPNPGIIVGRSSSGSMEGITEMSGAMSMSLPSRSQMEARSELVRR